MRKAQFRKLILGDYPYIASNSTYKRVILTGLMSIITAFISISFLFLDLATKEMDNLISNSIKYINQYKSPSFIKICAKQNDQHLELDITDNGVGIDNQYVGRIFDMFFKPMQRLRALALASILQKRP